MPFQQDTAFADDVGQGFGIYRSTFRSQTGQIKAQLFENNGWLIAHVWFPTGLDLEDVTDAYLGELKHFAAENGFEGRLRIVYSE